MNAGDGVKPKHKPIRTCVGCGTTSQKTSLIRIVRTRQGKVIADDTGRQPGRGTYLCPDSSCWDRAIDRGAIERSLRSTISAADLDALRGYLPNRVGAQHLK
jgi:predicted RNA-binding protein YlxR (DUF448 family)